MRVGTGTVTALFTDIEGSTRLWEEQPESMRIALDRHDELVRTAIAADGGHVFKTVGDAFCAVFHSALDALRAATRAQQALGAEPWPQGTEIRVRMALHTGQCTERDGDYVGPMLNRLSRILGTAHGGQLVLSSATRGLVQDELPHDVSLVDLGEHRLRDLGRPERIFQVCAPGLATEFPALKSLHGSRQSNLPIQLTTFIG